MEVHQLQILRELGALGSVSAVARVMDVTPSAVSQHLAALQRGFQTPLTQKKGRTLVLTDAGQVLADAGAEVIDAMSAARTAVEQFEQSAGGTVSVSGFHSAGQTLFGSLLRELAGHRTSPDVRLTDEDVAQQDFPALTARYDLVIAHRLDHSPAWPTAGLRTITLAHEPLDVALPTDHPLAGHAALTAEQVAGERWVTTRGGYSPDDLVDAVAAVANRQVEIVHRINDYGTVNAIVAAGHAIGLVPRYTSPRAPEGTIVLRPLTGIGASRSIDLLTRPENLRRRSVRMVATALGRVVARIVRERE
jgi:DNA-binding transcriptional LysR family regulator